MTSRSRTTRTRRRTRRRRRRPRRRPEPEPTKPAPSRVDPGGTVSAGTADGRRRRSHASSSMRSPLQTEPVVLDDASRPSAARACARRPSTSLRSRAPRWTASPCARRTRRASCRSRFVSPPELRRLAHSRTVRPRASRPAGTVPDGADAVVPVEVVEDRGDRLTVPDEARAGQHIRPRGGDVSAGAVVVEPGSTLGPGADRCTRRLRSRDVYVCSARPTGRVLATGNELRSPGEDARARADLRVEPAHDRRRARRLGRRDRGAAGGGRRRGLASSRDRAWPRGGRSRHLGRCVDGASRPRSSRLQRSSGVEEVFWGVAVKPGKPLAFGVRGETLVFGLPGNPVSVARRSAAVRPPRAPRASGARATASRATSAGGSPLRFVGTRTATSSCAHAALESADGVRLEAVSGQESHMIVRAASADALVHVPARRRRDPGRRATCVSSRSTSDAARTAERNAPRGGGSAPSAYGAYRPKVIAATCAAAASQTSTTSADASET